MQASLFRVIPEQFLPDNNSVLYGVAPSTPTYDVLVLPGQSLDEAFTNNPSASVFVLAPGVHRLVEPATPPAGAYISGMPGAIVSGAKVLVGWQEDSENSRWYIDGQTQRIDRLVEGDDWDTHRNNYCEEVYFNGPALTHVASLEELTTGCFFFDYDNDRIYIADDPRGNTVEAAVCDTFLNPAQNITVSNLVVQHFGSPYQSAAIDSQGATGWTIQNVEVRWCHAIGMRVDSGGSMKHNIGRHCGQNGIAGSGNSLVIEYNRIYRNGFNFDVDWAAAGTKFAWSDGLTIRWNWVHDNLGNGLWTDLDNVNVLYEYNLCEANGYAGIFHEVSYDATIRRNILRNNGHVPGVDWWPLYGGLLISGSQNVEVYENYVAENGAGIAIIETDRVDLEEQPYISDNINVHHNKLVMLGGHTGGQASLDRQEFYSRNITFDFNEYDVVGLASAWYWNESPRTWVQWQAAGFDANGIINVLEIEDTEETWPGIDGSAWNALRWPLQYGVGTMDIQQGEGRILCGTWVEQGAYWHKQSADMAVEFPMRRLVGDTEAYFDIYVAATGSGAPTDGYHLQIAWNGTQGNIFFYKRENGTSTWLGESALKPVSEQLFWLRLQKQGGSITGGAWLDGNTPARQEFIYNDSDPLVGLHTVVQVNGGPSGAEFRLGDMLFA